MKIINILIGLKKYKKNNFAILTLYVINNYNIK